MAELKTKVSDRSVTDFLDAVEDDQRRQDCYTILGMMKEATGSEGKMWGDSIVGFGDYHYVYATGRGGDWFLAGFSPRKQNLTLYIMSGFEQYGTLLQSLGKYKTGKSCLYINKLKDVDQSVLQKLIDESVRHMRATNP